MGIRDLFGAAGKGSFSKFKMHNFDSKQKESTIGPFRFIPPMGKLAKDPHGWRKYHRVHYGYKGVAFGTDKTKTKNRVFACIEVSDYKTKMITVSCPECRLIEQRERKLQDIKDDIKAQLKGLGVLDERLDKMVEEKAKVHEEGKGLIEWLDVHNCDGKYYVNLVDTEYAPGLVKLAKRHIEAIEEEVDKLAKLGVAALNDFDQGAWFSLTRRGSGSETKHLANYVAEPIPGMPGATKPKLAPLSDEVLERVMADCPDMSIPPMCSLLGADQIALLTECSGDPDEVDAIFKMTERTPDSTQDAQAATPRAAAEPPKAKLPTPSTATAPKAQAAEGTGVDPRYAQLKAVGLTDAQIEAAIGKPKPVAPPPKLVDHRIAQMRAMGLADTQIEAALGIKIEAPTLTKAEAEAIETLESGNTTTQLPAGHDIISLAKKAEAVKAAKTESERIAAEPSSMDPGLDPDMDPAQFAADFALPPR